MIIIRAGLKCGGQPVRTQPFVICVSTGQFPRLSLRQQMGLCYDENNKFSFAKGELGMKKTILLVILQQYADWEAAYIASAITMLGQGQYEVKTVSLARDCVQSIGGLRVLPDYDIASAPEVYEALILIGGMTWRSEQTQQIKPLVEDCCQKGRILGGICDAAGFLGTVGVLNHVKHTGNDMQDLKQWAGSNYTGEANYVAKQAVRDGAIITANGTAPLEFAKEILLALHVAEEGKIADWYHFHKLGFYTAPMPAM